MNVLDDIKDLNKDILTLGDIIALFKRGVITVIDNGKITNFILEN